MTSTGLACQRWDAQEPHVHDRTPDNYPVYGLEENYCRYVMNSRISERKLFDFFCNELANATASYLAITAILTVRNVLGVTRLIRTRGGNIVMLPNVLKTLVRVTRDPSGWNKWIVVRLGLNKLTTAVHKVRRKVV